MKTTLIALSLNLASFAVSAIEPLAAKHPGAMPLNPELDGRAIVARAHAAAGGETWVRPRSLHMTGYGVFYRGGKAAIHERHEMWRVYPQTKDDAHAADGKVRIDSIRDGKAVFQVSFDGKTTYTAKGPMKEPADSKRWQANFGFGVIRFALDEGYGVRREADDRIEGRVAHNGYRHRSRAAGKPCSPLPRTITRY